MVKGNPNLEPEKSKGLTFNLDFSNDNSFRLNFLGYYNVFYNKISTEQQTNSAMLPTVFSYQNISEATFKGFEIFSDYILGTEFRIGSVFLLFVLILVYRRFKLSRKREYLK